MARIFNSYRVLSPNTVLHHRPLTPTTLRGLCTEENSRKSLKFAGEVHRDGKTDAAVKAPKEIPDYLGTLGGLLAKPFLGKGLAYSGAKKRWSIIWNGEDKEQKSSAKFIQPPQIHVVEQNGVMKFFVPLAGYERENVKVQNLGHSMKVHCGSEDGPMGERSVVAKLVYPHGDRKLKDNDFRAYWNDNMKMLIVEVYYYEKQIFDVKVHEDGVGEVGADEEKEGLVGETDGEDKKV